MDEWPKIDPDEEETVRRLLEEAGPRPPIPQEDLDAITAAARSAWQAQVRQRKHRRRALAAGLVAVLAVAVGLTQWWISRSGGASPTVARVEAVTGPVYLGSRGIAAGDPIPLGSALRSQGKASLRLSDNATVRLDTETRMRFASAAVLELERGALYLDTGSGALEIRTPVGTVRDAGTRFAVRIVDRTSLLVRVRDGAVLTEHRGRTWRTEAGQELALRGDGTGEIRAAAIHGPDWDWILEAAPGFDIEGRSLRELLDWVSAETGWRIVLEGELAESADKIVLHGSLGRLRPDQAPFAVLPGAGLEGELEDGTLVVHLRSPR